MNLVYLGEGETYNEDLGQEIFEEDCVSKY